MNSYRQRAPAQLLLCPDHFTPMCLKLDNIRADIYPDCVPCLLIKPVQIKNYILVFLYTLFSQVQDGVGGGVTQPHTYV